MNATICSRRKQAVGTAMRLAQQCHRDTHAYATADGFVVTDQQQPGEQPISELCPNLLAGIFSAT